MGDICGGSETVSMVKKVISWKSATAGRNPSLWDDLIAANQSMHLSFQQLNDLESKKIDFKSTLNDLSNTKAAIVSHFSYRSTHHSCQIVEDIGLRRCEVSDTASKCF